MSKLFWAVLVQWMVQACGASYQWPRAQLGSAAINLTATMMPPTFSSTLGNPEVRIFYTTDTSAAVHLFVTACDNRTSICVELLSQWITFDPVYCERRKLPAVATLPTGNYSIGVHINDNGVISNITMPYTLYSGSTASPRRVGGAWIGA
jgi:hypothetical protein